MLPQQALSASTSDLSQSQQQGGESSKSTPFNSNKSSGLMNSKDAGNF